MTASITGVEFASPLPGLGPHTSFTLGGIEGAEGLYALRAAAEGLRLFLLDPASPNYGSSAPFASAGEGEYRPELTAGVCAQVGATDESEVRVFVVANPADDGIYLNLRAPIVVHRDTGRAAQVILDDPSFPIRTPLGAEIFR